MKKRRTAISLTLFLLAVTAGIGARADTITSKRTHPHTDIPKPGNSMQDEPVRLEIGQPQSRELAGGQAHKYQLEMIDGQFLRAQIKAPRGPFGLTLFGPDGRRLAGLVMDSDATDVNEEFALVVPLTGKYRLEASADKPEPAAISYRLEITDKRAATEADRHYAQGWQLHQEGVLAEARNTSADRQQAVTKFESALQHWRAAAAQRGEAETLYDLGQTRNVLGEYRAALANFQQALALFRALGDRVQEAHLLNVAGGAYRSLGEYPQARASLEAGLELSRTLGAQSIETGALTRLGQVWSELGDTRKAIECYQQALPLARALGHRYTESSLLSNLGARSLDMGEPYRALDYYQQSLALDRATNNRDGEGYSIYSLAAVHYRLDEIQQSLDYAQQALVILRATGARRVEAAALRSLGTSWLRLGDTEQAEQYFNAALALNRATGVRRDEAINLANLGKTYFQQTNWPRALEQFQQAYDMHRQMKDRGQELTVLNWLGQTRAALGEWQTALTLFQQALPLSRELGMPYEEASTLLEIGRLHRGLKAGLEAAEFLNQALTLSRAIFASRIETQALEELAQLALQEGRHNEAREYSLQAVNLAETKGARIVSQDLRSGFRATAQRSYELLTESLMQLHQRQPAGHFIENAFATSERARARALIELLAEARADIHQGVDATLLQQERELQQRLAAKAERLALLRPTAANREQLAAFKLELTALSAEAREISARIRAGSPAYAALTQSQPLTLGEIQKQTLDRNTLLLEYSLGAERSYLFAVTQTGLTAYVLPNREKIETAARRVAQLLNNRPASGVAASAEYQKAASELSGMILQPVADQLRGQRLVIVADGALHYVPFAALPVPMDRHRPPLIVNHEIVNLPSATALAVLRREVKGRQAAPKAVAVLADPVFSADDERLSVALQGKATAKEPVVAMASDTARMLRGGFDTVQLPRLQMSRAEAEMIGKLTPPDAGFKAMDFQATRATAMSTELSQYRIVHFATHGVFNSQHPELSGLIFSLVNERGAAQNGLLGVGEIYNLKLPAELVVLSACRTGLGKEIKGEGVVGLTRGFMYAGSKRVVASLWNVSDAATSALMQKFYQGMFGEKHLSPAAALRAAQLAMWREQRWQAPFYWAAFALQGEW